jgi:hypothetical protein
LSANDSNVQPSDATAAYEPSWGVYTEAHSADKPHRQTEQEEPMPTPPASLPTHSGLIHWPDMDLPYRVAVVAASIDDAVSSVGAWLFDRAKGGWKVRVFVADPKDPLPLQILGVDTVEPITELRSADLQRSTALAIRGEVLTSNAMLAQRVYAPVLRQGKEVLIWGEPPEKMRHECEMVWYASPSSAASAFKKRALAAAGINASGDPTPETFHWAVRSTLRYSTDLSARS